MDVLDIFAFVVFAVLIAAAVIIIVGLGSLPGAVARKRGHPQAAAVNVASWLGMATLGIFWPLALIWAFWKPSGSGTTVNPQPFSPATATGDSAQAEILRARVDALEVAVRQLKTGKEIAT